MHINNHSTSISIGKAIAIILMVVGHSGCPEPLRAWIYTFHMPFFFFVSGYCFNEKYLDAPQSFIKKRMKSLWLPFVKWEILFLLLHNLFYRCHFYEQCYSYKEMVKRFFQYLYMFGSEQLLGGFWFLRQLLLASILGWIVIKAAQTLRKRFPSLDYKMLCFMGGGDILLIFTTLSYKHNLRIPFLMNKLSFLSALFYMSGYIFKIYSPKISQWLLPVLFMITTIGSVMCPVSMLDMKIQWLLPYIAIALTGCIMVFIMSDIISHTPLSILGNYVGTHTLTILTWHFLMFKFISIIIIVINKMDINLLSAFPVIEQEAHKEWWIAYAIVGISFPLYMANKKENYQSKTVNKNSTH